MGFMDKVKDFARKNPDKVDKVMEKVGDTFDTRTGGKYAKHTDTVQQRGGDYLKGAPGQPPAAGQPPAGTQPPAEGRPPA